MRRSAYDAEIVRLALPALGALAAEPVYLLTDTAIVGHLGTPELAALAIAATVLGACTALCIFLTYGTTARVARLHGAGERGEADALAAQALWLSSALGTIIATAVLLAAGPLAQAFGGDPEVERMAARYLRIAALGLPMALIALAAQGWMRGVGDLRKPLRIVVAANVANVVLELLFVYGFGWGLDGSAVGTVIAQAGMGAAFASALLRAPAATRAPDLRRIASLTSIGAQLLVRSAALYSCFLLATAVCARIGTPSLGAHQIAFGLFTFVALVLDAIAIAGQVIVGRALGAGDAPDAVAAARRMLELAVAGGLAIAGVLLALRGVLPRVFSTDDAVLDRARALWPLFCLMWPLAAAVFALDGILIGAGDTRFLAWAMLVALAAFVPIVLAADTVGGVWVALNVLMAVRCATLGARFSRGGWAQVGART